ncbi:hypothetical protein Dimus_035092 [Dionaea muscipula]
MNVSHDEVTLDKLLVVEDHRKITSFNNRNPVMRCFHQDYFSFATIIEKFFMNKYNTTVVTIQLWHLINFLRSTIDPRMLLTMAAGSLVQPAADAGKGIYIYLKQKYHYAKNLHENYDELLEEAGVEASMERLRKILL